MKIIKPAVLWVLVIAWMIIIFGMSSSTAEQSSEQSDGFIRTVLSVFFEKIDDSLVDGLHNAVRKLAHFAEYAILGLLLSLAVGCHINKLLPRFFIAFAIGAVYAVSDEIHQIFVPGRAGMIEDVLLDSAGVAIGAAFVALCAIFIIKFKSRKMKA